MVSFFKKLFQRRTSAAQSVSLEDVTRAREGAAALDDVALVHAAKKARTLPEVIGVTAVVASRVLGLQMFDEQLMASIALAHGEVVEMQTGEGKTLAAVPAIAWLARSGGGVHVLTANDYLARRDADWMREIYTRLGLSVAAIQQGDAPAARRGAYRADVTYATAREVGFDLLRDGLALDREAQVLRRFAAAVVDEADSILIDEARTPLVIAGGAADAIDAAVQADRAIREMLPSHHFVVEGHGRNATFTPQGIRRLEHAFGCDNLYDDSQIGAHTAAQDALHAHVLLRRDVDYLVRDGVVLPVDEFTGRVVSDRRWPSGLQEAIEVKERVGTRAQGRVLGSITIEHLMARYPQVCGMTGTAATQAEELRTVYGLDVRVIPTHRPVIRHDEPDRIFASRAEKEAAVRDEVRRVHAIGRPVLVGTANVAESERLSRALFDVPHHVLNARHETAEAAIIARAGEPGAVTISTNMAGRGVDIRLGNSVAALGGLHVIGMQRHASRRIDHQLRGRAGRQGDPGSSVFFVSREDAVLAPFLDEDPQIPPDQCQRMMEGQHLDTRIFLRKYETILEAQRREVAAWRQDVLETPDEQQPPDVRHVRLAAIDDLWADYVAAIAEQRAGTIWISLAFSDPFGHYLRQVHAMYAELTAAIAEAAIAPDAVPTTVRDRGTTWTYITTDEPFGSMTARVMRQIAARHRRRAIG